MIESVFLILGFVIYFEIVFEKWGVFNWLSFQGSRSKFKFIYTLTNCRFCLLFWISTIITLIYFSIKGFEVYGVVVPPVVIGLIFLIRKK